MKIRRHSLIFGLSYALDIAGNNNLSHSKSAAYLSALIGGELGWRNDELLALYYAALLHDIGVSSEYELFGHCKIGADMLKKLPLPKEIAEYVLYHHEINDGSGPFSLNDKDIPAGARIICFASAFDDAFGKNRGSFDKGLFLTVCKWADGRRGLFSDEVVSAFKKLTERESFLLDYFNQETKYALSGKMFVKDDVSYGYDEALSFALCFADIIDRRSPFTYAHSKGIAALARKAAEYLGYDKETADSMYIAGLLHDIGKLRVSADILHKNGPLTPEERFEINKHTYYTRKILEQMPEFEKITEYASNHHEKMDGTGYPYRMPGSSLSELERAMAVCDVYQALTEERPYRAKLQEAEVWGIIGGMTEKGHLDGILASKLKLAFAGNEEV